MKTLSVFVSLFLYSALVVAQSPYVYMTSDGNHYNQEVLQTNDGGYLMASRQYCYTPGQVVIEGCTNAILLQKLNANKEVLWENEFSYPGGNSARTGLFEHEDGTYTLIADETGNNFCNGVIAGFGIFSHLLIKNLDAQGNVTASTTFPEDCEQEIRDAVQLDDNRFAVLSYFSEFGMADPLKEGRLSIISKTGEILNEVILPNVAFNEGHLFLKADGSLHVLYNEGQGTFKSLSFNGGLSPIGSVSTSEIETVYQLSGYKRSRITPLENGGWIFLVDFPHEEIDNTYFFRFDANFELEAEAIYTLDSPTNIIQTLDDPNTYVMAASHQNPDGSLDVGMLEMDPDGNLGYSWVIEADDDERPRWIAAHATESFLLTGSVNCCNEPDNIGPGYSFLLVGDSVVDTDNPSGWDSRIQITLTLERAAMELDVFDPTLLNQSLNISIYNASGQVMHTQAVIESKTTIVMSGWAEGLYSYAVESNGELIKNGLLVRI